MSGGSEAASIKRQAAPGGADRLGGLPNEILLEILSFLPSPDAVRTCVLAVRWRNLWKGVPALRITPATAESFAGPSALNGFVNTFLFLRDRSPLSVAELNSFPSVEDDSDDSDEAVKDLEHWVRYSLSCRAAKLYVAGNDEPWLLPEGLIASEHLTTVVLTRVRTDYDLEILDFSNCKCLMDLKMNDSSIYCNKITSPSLKRLTITECLFFGDVHIQISVPNLIFLTLDGCTPRAPFLHSMPALVEAIVRRCGDPCQNGYEVGDCGDLSCWGCSYNCYGKNSCLLQALSSCTTLELGATTKQFIFRKDLMQCPVFSKLKTLLLDEWWITADLAALICFLQHSPVLEKLTLQFPQIYEKFVEMGASYDLKKQPFLMKDLTVELKCYEGDQLIQKVLDLLHSYGLSPEKITIQQSPKADRDLIQ